MVNQIDLFDKDYSISNIIDYILSYTNKWTFYHKAGCPWFRGQDCEDSPKPSIYRGDYDEFHINTTFRNRASALNDVPETNRLDKWLFLMQHYGVPTRLLDWTENLLNALFFALDGYNELCECKRKKDGKMLNPSIWAIHPLKLNEHSNVGNDFPNTWCRHDDENGINLNPGIEHFRLGFHTKEQWIQPNIINMKIVKFPIAVHANFLDLRIFSQQSCFTIHGTDERSFENIFEDTSLVSYNYFLKFVIPNQYSSKLLIELENMGYNKAKIFPDLEHFALDLKKRFKS